MKRNMGTIDRVVRIVLALAVAVLWLGNVISGTVAIVLGALAAILIITSAVSICPLYLPFRISTRGKED